MKVEMIRTRSIQAVGANGPFTRVFSIGEVHDLPEMHANMFVAGKDAVLVSDKPAKVADKPAVKATEPVSEPVVAVASPAKAAPKKSR